MDSSLDEFSFPERTRIRITVDGTISRRYIDNIGGAWDVLSGTEYPPLDANAEWMGSDRSGHVYTDFAGVGKANAMVIGPSPNSAHSPTVGSYSTDPVIVRGTGRLRRSSFAQPSTPGPPQCSSSRKCVVSAGGFQTVTIEITSVTLTLTAQPDSITAGDLVTFTASSALAVAVKEWVWAPADGNGHTPVSSCAGQQVSCTLPVFESGTMYVLAKVGSNPSTAVLERAHASVLAAEPEYPIVQCPTGDSLLDLAATRALLRELAWRNDSLTPRVEWSGVVYQLPDGSYRFLVDTVSPTDPIRVPEPCRTSDYNVTVPAGWTRVLRAHSHPGVAGDVICQQSKPMTVRLGWRGGVLSPADWDLADIVFSPQQPAVPQVVIDRNEIAVGRTGAWANTWPNPPYKKVPDSSQFAANYLSVPRQGASCAIP